MIIDLHAHNLTPGMMNAHEHWGPHFEVDDSGQPRLRVGDWILTLGTREAAEQARASGQAISPVEGMRAPNRLQQMDERGIDKMVVSVPAHAYMYHTGEFGAQWCRIVNDEFAAYCEYAPERLFFWAPVPMQDPGAAAAELERAVGLGARGLNCGGINFGGLEFDDEALDVVWAKCVDLDVPIFIHGYNQSVTWGKKAREERYMSSSIVGFCDDEVRAFWNLVCGGVFDRFPDLKVYITHGGGFVPYQLGRLEQTNTNLSDGKNKLPLGDYMRNFWFDPLIHEPIMRQAVIDLVGADRLLYGDNFGGSDQIRSNLLDGMKLSAKDSEKISSENARELLRIT